MTKDFIPSTWSAFAEWMDNFAAQLPGLAAKYGVLPAKAAAVGLDNKWVQYWVQAKFNAKMQEKQLTDFIEDVVNGSLGKPIPNAPVWTLPPDPPAAVQTGIKKRAREIAAGIKAQKSIYTEADGELLGIIAPDEAGLSPDDAAPQLKLRPIANYALEIEFRKFGMDALRVETKQKGGDWKLAAILTTSPATVSIIPLTPGDAEKIETRGVFLEKNEIYGNYSPTYNAVIQP